MILVSNHRLSTLILVLISTLGLGLAIYLRAPVNLLTAFSFFAVWLSGITLATMQIDRFIERARFQLSNNVTTSIPSSTGLKCLDKIVQEQQRHRTHLLETIASVSSEAEAIIERYELLTENLAAAVIIKNQEGRIGYCSPYTEVLTGYPTADIYNQNYDFFEQLVHEDDLDLYKRAQGVSACGEPYQYRFRFYHKTGLEMWAESRSVPILNQSGEVTHVLAIILDVTSAVRFQQQVQEQTRDAQDFAYMVSHDLKAPIATIRGMTIALKEDCASELDSNANETLEHILGACSRVSALVSSVIQYSGINAEKAQLSEINLNEVISEVLKDLQLQLNDTKAEIKVAALPIVKGDKVKIYQIMSNLIGNALKFKKPGSIPQIEIEEQTSSSNRKTKIIVRDHGIGIASDKHELIFRPFHRAHSEEIEGTGVGLACVRKLIHKVGGKIEVQSSNDNGTEFCLTLRRS